MRLVTSYGTGEYAVGEAHAYTARRLRRPGDDARLVIQCHGRDATALEGLDAVYGAAARGLADLGYPVLSIDAGGKRTWGNDASINAVVNAVAWARANRFAVSATKDPIIIGVSMGGATALNYARAHDAAAVVSLIGAVDVDDLHDRNYNGFAAEIEAAWGGAAAYEAAKLTHNPIDNLAQFDGSVPTCFWYSDTDPVTPLAKVQQAAELAGGNLFSMGAIGHSVAGLDVRTLTDWVTRVAPV